MQQEQRNLFHSWKQKEIYDIRVKDAGEPHYGDTSGELGGGDGAIESCSQFPTATTTEAGGGRLWHKNSTIRPQKIQQPHVGPTL